MNMNKDRIAVVDYIGPDEMRGYAIASYDSTNKVWTAGGTLCSSAKTAVMGANPEKLRLYITKDAITTMFDANRYDIDWFIDSPTTSDMLKA